MKCQKHLNYFEELLLAGGKVIGTLKMTAVSDYSKGRQWEASAAIAFNKCYYRLHAKFHGGKAETEEVAKANLKVELIACPSANKEHKRNSFGILLLSTGIYVPAVTLTEGNLAVLREMCCYDTAQYMGIPEEQDLCIILAMGFIPLIEWKK